MPMKISGIHVSTNNLITIELPFFAFTFLNFCRACCGWNNLANGRRVHWGQWVYACCLEHITWKSFFFCYFFVCVRACLCRCVLCVCGVWWSGGCKDITESYRGDQVQLIIKEPKSSNPHPPSLRWWIMTGPHLVIDSYIFFTLLFYLLIYLFILKFFFTRGK